MKRQEPQAKALLPKCTRIFVKFFLLSAICFSLISGCNQEGNKSAAKTVQKFSPPTAQAQTAQHIHTNGCSIEHATEKAYLKATPQQREIMENAKKKLELASKASGNLQKAPLNITIPVVVHVVHNYGPEYIGEAQIIDAIDQMNEDFAAWPYAGSIDGFDYLQADVGFTFKLATLDPDGNPTNGITYTASTVTYDGTEGPLQATINWPREKYLNIWVVNSSDGTGSGSAYSNYPSTVDNGTGNEYWDGIVVSYWAMGRTGTAISTHYKILTHEAGHWANLKHTWGDVYNNGDSYACYDDDGVADTPNTIGNTGCSAGYSCGSWDNIENFMDYGYCTTMFTIGQSDRMQTAMTSSVADRNNLWTEANLVATGLLTGNLAPTANANGPYYSYKNTAISFSSAGSNEPGGNITSYSWDFGDSTNSSQANPSHSYNSTGTFNVSLTVTDDDGQTATATTTATIIEPGSFIDQESEPNNSSGQADGPTGPFPAVNGAISSSSDQDWYYFDVTSQGSVKVRLDILGNYADLDMWVYHESDLSNWVIEGYTDNPSQPYEQGEFNATQLGRYYVLVDGWSTETGNYSLKLTAANIDGGNTNTLTANANGPYTGSVGIPINFSSAGSSASSGSSITGYLWDFGDGSGSTQANPSHTYTSTGSYTASLQITASNGNTASATAAVTINSGNSSHISRESESNGSASQANGPVGANQLVSGEISTRSDQDWFYFDVSGPGTITVRLDILGNYADLDMWVYHESDLSNWIIEGYTDDPARPYEEGQFNATQNGRYYIFVDGLRSETSEYSLEINGTNIQ